MVPWIMGACLHFAASICPGVKMVPAFQSRLNASFLPSQGATSQLTAALQLDTEAHRQKLWVWGRG